MTARTCLAVSSILIAACSSDSSGAASAPDASPPSSQPSSTGQPEPEAACKNECGNGTCQEMVCMAVGCPCAETKASCPQDCK